MSESAWDPAQYERFGAERRRPFDDLLAGVDLVPGGTAVDLGCGPGTLTIDLHRRLRAATTVGIDESPTMLDQAHARLADARSGDGPDHDLDGLTFERGRLQDWTPSRPVDVIFANASLQWVPDHPTLLARLSDRLAPGGQLAFQVPANHDHPSHEVADRLGRELGLQVNGGAANVLAPEDYATVLHDLSLVQVDVRLQVYGFELARSADLVEWTKGTLLTGYRAQLDPPAYNAFVEEYRRRLAEVVGDHQPYYYAFKRILAWARSSVGGR